MSFIAVARHYTAVNTKLLDLGLFDTMIEVLPPTKEQRYKVIKESIAPEQYQNKEILL
jgi:hypothetical protein